MEPKYLAKELIVDPNHPLTFGDWIPRDSFLWGLFQKKMPFTARPKASLSSPSPSQAELRSSLLSTCADITTGDWQHWHGYPTKTIEYPVQHVLYIKYSIYIYLYICSDKCRQVYHGHGSHGYVL